MTGDDGSLFEDRFVVQVRPGLTTCPGCGYELRLRVAPALHEGDGRSSNCPRCGVGIVAWVEGDAPVPATVTPIRKAKAPGGEPPEA